MTSIPIHATEERLMVASRAGNTVTTQVEPEMRPQPRGVHGVAIQLLRKPHLVDLALLFAAFWIASVLAPIGSINPVVVAVVASGATVSVARRIGVYATAVADVSAVASRRAAQALGISIAGFLLLAYVVDFAHDRAWLPIAIGGATAAFMMHRSAARALTSHPKILPCVTTRLALLGDAAAIAKFSSSNNHDARSVVVHRTELENDTDVRPALRQVEEIIEMANNGDVDRVVVLASAPGIPVVNAVVRRCSLRGVPIDLLTGATGVSPSRLDIGRIQGFATVHIRPGLHSRGRIILKRLFDFVVASLALVVFAPLMAIIAVVVKVGSPGPVFYKQRRLGRGGQQFEMLKFRSMVPEADQMLVDLEEQNEADGPLFKIKDDPRITRAGGFLRRTSMDELPQLWNVVRGQMSLVGPRPALAIEADGWPVELFDRLEVPPGITGLWQVSGRSNASFGDYARLDLYYVDNWSIALDVAILARTIPALLGRGAY